MTTKKIVSFSSYFSFVSFLDVSKTVQFRRICPQSVTALSFRQVSNDQPVIGLGNGSLSAAIVHQVWTEDDLRNFQDCKFIVDGNMYSDNSMYKRGLFMSIRQINLRKLSNSMDYEKDCIDYVRISFSGQHLQKICGKFNANTELGKQSFLRAEDGIFEIHLHLDSSQSLNAAQRELELELVFTAYESKKTQLKLR